jgi:hypothetical protein
MNQGNPNQPLNESEILDTLLNRDAENFQYPTTPNIAGHTPWRTQPVRRVPISRRLLWATILLVALLGGLLAVPQVRAAILEILHIGNISIIPATMTPAPAPTGTVLPYPSPTPLVSILDLAGATTLKEAEVALNASIRLPTYPASLGRPDKVFVQGFGSPVIILVWADKTHPEQAQMSLYILGPNVYADKFSPRIIQQTTVNGHPAVWAQGDHAIQVKSGQGPDYIFTHLVKGNVLVWSENKLSYRLETELPVEEAVKVAESLR